jgi:hypothetical protein
MVVAAVRRQNQENDTVIRLIAGNGGTSIRGTPSMMDRMAEGLVKAGIDPGEEREASRGPGSRTATIDAKVLALTGAIEQAVYRAM